MKSYLDIVEKVLSTGHHKETRAGDTLALPSMYWEHNMEDGFPLLTIRKMPMRSIAVELEGFIKGITSKKWYQDRKCHFWDSWANPKVVDKMVADIGNPAIDHGPHWREKQRPWLAEICDDLGPLGYSFQQRRFGEAWDEDDNGSIEGVDQLANLVNTLKTNPNDRRMVVSFWSPAQLDRMALPPCTVDYVVTVMGGKVNLNWQQRSCDLLLGGGSDIASMALLLTLLCVESNLHIGKLSCVFVDCHIYKNQIEQAKILLSREPRPLPRLGIDYKGSIFDWTHKDFRLYDYNPHPALDIELSV